MTTWIRFERDGRARFGTLEGARVAEHDGDMFAGSAPTGEIHDLGTVKVLVPSTGKMICLWNNFAANAAKQGLSRPEEPLWFIKADSSYLADGAPIRRPASYAGKIVYEGELGIVIGRRCADASEAEAGAAIFGYTIVNDVTAIELIGKDASFAQWTRAKSFDTFGAFGPVIATGLDPATLSVRTVLNGQERQNYPISDMFFSVAELVARLSRDVTLMPGDVIACGTSVGVGTMSKAENVVEVSIEGIGVLRNTLTQAVAG